MAGSRDKMAIACIEIEVIKAFEGSEWIRHDLAQLGLGLSKDFVEESKPPAAFETFEKGGSENIDVVAVPKMLEKIPATLKEAETAADACLKPKLIWKGRAVSAGPGKIEKPEKGFQKFDTDDGFTGKQIGHEFF